MGKYKVIKKGGVLIVSEALTNQQFEIGGWLCKCKICQASVVRQMYMYDYFFIKNTYEPPQIFWFGHESNA